MFEQEIGECLCSMFNSKSFDKPEALFFETRWTPMCYYSQRKPSRAYTQESSVNPQTSVLQWELSYVVIKKESMQSNRWNKKVRCKNTFIPHYRPYRNKLFPLRASDGIKYSLTLSQCKQCVRNQSLIYCYWKEWTEK